MNFTKRGLATFAGIYSGLIFGIYWIPLRALGESGFQGIWSTAVFSAVPAIIVLPAVWVYRKHFFPGRLRFHACGLLLGVGFVLYAGAFMYTEVVRTILLYYMMPVWGFVLARIFIGEAITPVRLLSMTFGLAGMLVIFGFDNGFPLPSNQGDWMALLGGMIWALAALVILTDKRVEPLPLTTAFFIWCLICTVAVAWWMTDRGIVPPPDLSRIADIMFWLIPFSFIVVIPAGFATIYSPTQLNPGVVGLLFMTEISIGTATAALFANEPFGGPEIAGVILITLAGLLEPLWLLIGRKHSSSV